MKNKKGFTLVELLAVIVILAVIALIAVPITLNIIENIKDKANRQTVNGLISGAEYYYMGSMLDEEKKNNIENINNIYDLIEVEGSKPLEGQLYVNENGEVALSVVIGKKCYVKNFNTELQEYEKDNEACDLGYVSVDKINPTITIEITGGEKGNDDWYIKAPTVIINASDEESGLLNYKWCQGKDCTPNNIETEIGKEIKIVDSSEVQICVQSQDKAGNASEIKCSDIFKVDTTMPEISGIEDKQVNINDEIDLISGVEISDATSGPDETFTTNPPTLEIIQTGEYKVEYIFKDKAGNEQTATRIITVSADAPEITFEEEAGAINEYGWAKDDFYVTINIKDNTGRGIKEVYVCTSNKSDRCEPTNIDSTVQDNKITRLIKTESNNNRICVKAIDNDNGASGVICSDSYKLDKTAPSIGSISVNKEVPSEEWYKEDIVITTTDGSDSLSGHLETTVNINSITENTEGTIVKVITKDKAGNETTNSYTIKLDKTEPTVTITKESGSTKLTSTINPIEAKSGYSYKWYKNGSVISGATTSSYTPTDSGTYKLEVTTGAGVKVISNEVTINNYTVSYNVNGGTGSITNTTKVEDITTSITKTVPTRSGYEFIGWGTSSTDKTKDYSSGENYTLNENKTLYAIWKKTVEITFDGNGATISKTSATCDMYNTDTSCSVNAPTITRSGFTITGFNTSKDATESQVASGGSVAVSSNTTYYAITSKEITVSYLGNGSTSGSTSSQTCTIKNSATSCNITLSVSGFIKTNYTFEGWGITTDSVNYNFGTQYSFSDNITLNAIWKQTGVEIDCNSYSNLSEIEIVCTNGKANISPESYDCLVKAKKYADNYNCSSLCANAGAGASACGSACYKDIFKQEYNLCYGGATISCNDYLFNGLPEYSLEAIPQNICPTGTTSASVSRDLYYCLVNARISADTSAGNCTNQGVSSEQCTIDWYGNFHGNIKRCCDTYGCYK